jgi:hypothetical protein
LSEADVIRLISTSFVPVALNLYEIRKEKGEAGDFFRQVQKQRPAQYQGLYVVSADCKVLSSHQAFKSHKTWPAEVTASLNEGIKEFGPIAPRQVERIDPTPCRGIGVQPDGAVTLAIYTRYAIKGIPLREVPDPTVDSLTLSAKEFAAFEPPARRVGATWTFPEELAKKFSRVLGPRDEDSMPRPNEVTSVEFKGKVLRVENDVVNLGFEGQIAGNHTTQAKKTTQSNAKIVGAGAYDLKAGELRSFTWILDGTFRGPVPYDQPHNFHAVVEWRKK